MLRPRILMLILLLPLAALWCWLAIYFPFANWPGLNPFSDGKQFSLSHHHEKWEDFLILNIDTKQVRHTNSVVEGYPPSHGMQWAYSFDILKSDKTGSTIRLNIYDHREHRTLRSIELNLPSSAVIRPVADHFMVISTDDLIRILDWTDPSATVHTFPTTYGQESWIVRHPQLPFFLRTAHKAVSPQSTAAPQSFTELFRVDAAGQLNSLATWPSATSGADPILGDARFHGDKLYSLDVTGRMIEVHSIVDGQLLKTIEMPASFDRTQHAFGFTDGLLSFSKGLTRSELQWQYFSLAQEKWLVPPLEVNDAWTKASLRLSSDSRLALWTGRQNSDEVCVTDTATDRLLCRIQHPGERFAFLDDHTLISIDPWFGLTVRQHDLNSGATLWTWRPFWWSLPVFALTLAVSVVWVSCWLRLARTSSLWAWLDVHTIMFIFMSLIVLRLKSAGASEDISRLPYQHAMYLTSGFQLVALAWVILGSGSVVSRLSQLLIVHAIVFGSLSLALYAQPQRAWMGAALVSIPSLLSLPVFALARWRGWKWPSPVDSQNAHDANARAELVTLRQLLTVTAICAVLSLVIRPIAPGIEGVFQLRWPIWLAITITASGLLGIYMASANNARLHRYGGALAMGILLLLLSEALISALYAGWWMPLWLSPHEVAIRNVMGIYAICFLVTCMIVSQLSTWTHPIRG